MGKKRKFIDKKKSITFRLEHRSQKDPELANEEAPERVLVPVEDKRKRYEEQLKFGIYYEDDYNYLQHLRDANEVGEWPEELVERVRIPTSAIKVSQSQTRLNLPSVLFPSKVETEVGLLNRAAPVSGPQPDLDPDVIAALDDDFDFDDPENQLEDDFMAVANEGEMNGNENYENDKENSSNEMDSELGVGSDLAEFSDDDENEDRPTNPVPSTQKTTSCRWARTKPHEQFLDEWSDTFVAKHYAPDSIGPLDHVDDWEGIGMDNPAFLQAMAADEKALNCEKNWKEDFDNRDDKVIRIPQEEEEKVKVIVKTILKYDVETKPKPMEIHGLQDLGQILFGKNGLPKEKSLKVIRSRKDSTESSVDLASFRADRPSTYRPKDETSEEKRLRKKAIKDEQAVRRQEKKAHKIAFKCEKLKQEEALAAVRQNMAGIKMF